MASHIQAGFFVVSLFLASFAAHSSYKAARANVEASKINSATVEGFLKAIGKANSCDADPA